MHPRQLILGWD